MLPNSQIEGTLSNRFFFNTKKMLEKFLQKNIVFNVATDCRPIVLLKMNLFTGIFQKI